MTQLQAKQDFLVPVLGGIDGHGHMIYILVTAAGHFQAAGDGCMREQGSVFAATETLLFECDHQFAVIDDASG